LKTPFHVEEEVEVEVEEEEEEEEEEEDIFVKIDYDEISTENHVTYKGTFLLTTSLNHMNKRQKGKRYDHDFLQVCERSCEVRLPQGCNVSPVESTFQKRHHLHVNDKPLGSALRPRPQVGLFIIISSSFKAWHTAKCEGRKISYEKKNGI